MQEKSLEFNLSIKTEPETGDIIEITGLDIDFDVMKTNTAENNKAAVVIWNLDDTSYQNLVEKESKVCLYAGYGEDEPSLVFRGYINKIVKKNDGNTADIPVYMELADGKLSYTNAFMNKNYRDNVSSTVIIKDCINAMGLSTGSISSNIPERIYNGYKAIGPAHCVLQKVCLPLGVKFSIQNELVHVLSPGDEPIEETATELDIENSMRPRRIGQNEMVITTGFIPHINPNGTVKCNFSEFSGLRLVKRVHSFGNNYGKAIITEITV